MCAEERIARVRAERRGRRAEEVAEWYFRLNGFLSIPGFVVHPDLVRDYPRTEADLIAARFPYSQEVIASRAMEDDNRLTLLAAPPQTLFVLVEVKADLCKINGPWSAREHGNMQRVIRRLGFLEEAQVEGVAEAMYADLRWEGRHAVLQYLSVGGRFNDGLQRRFPLLLQITWDEIADFLHARFAHFPEKLPTPGRAVHQQWPGFGRAYGARFRRLKTVSDSRAYIRRYINPDEGDVRVPDQGDSMK